MKNFSLTNGTYFDSTDGSIRPLGTIEIEAGKIKTINPQQPKKDETATNQIRTINLQNKFVMPGLVDAHVHISAVEQKIADSLGEFQNSESILAIAGANNCMVALQNGVTTIRDLGAADYINIKLRESIRAGLIPGPRIVACGFALAMTGGHGTPGISYEIDNPDEARKAVRLMRKMGADCIKLMANGLSVNSPELTANEMRVAVETAHDAGMKVAAHASVWKAVENAVEAGVDTIEHGYTLNDVLIEKMLKKGILLIPTLGTVTQVARIGQQFSHWKDKMDAIHARLETAIKSFRLAKEMGVRFGMGTDGSSWPLLRVGEVSLELEAMQQVGFSNAELLQAATINSAEALDRQASIGAIEVGKDADLLILNSNPIDNLNALKDIFMVIKQGEIVNIPTVLHE